MSAAARVRALAAQAVLAVHEGQALDDALGDPITPSRALLQELAYGVTRWRSLLDHLLAPHLKAPRARLDARVHALLLVGLYQLRFLRIPAHAAVMETVSAVQDLGCPWARGLVNGILRSATRDPRLHATPEEVAIRHSHPDWLVSAIQSDWPAELETILAANNEVAPLSLRVNRQRNDRRQYVARLAGEQLALECPEAPDSALRMPRRPVKDIPGFSQGLVSVQDAGAQWAALLLEPSPGQRVLDACAAPGGKLAHLLEQNPGLEAVAVDRPGRVALIESTLQRLALKAEIVGADAAQPGSWWDQRPFDRVLLDVPCSGTGVIRRHPDIKWLRRPEDLAALVSGQDALLRALWPTLAVGGVLLYVTCSVLRCENEQRVAAFLAQSPDAEEVPFALPEGRACHPGWQILPGEGRMDGFYYARLRKRAP